jgi:hypothetical protein
MPRPTETGVCILCIDLTIAGNGPSLRNDPSPAQVEGLQQRLVEAGIAVTWGVGASQTALGKTLVAGDTRAEAAFVANPSWSTGDTSRRPFAEGLNHGVAQLRSLGLHTTTLVLFNERWREHDDLLVKQGIQVVLDRAQSSDQSSHGWWPRSAKGPAKSFRSVRWGLWEAVTTVNLDYDGPRAVERTIDRLHREGGLAIVVASAARLATNEQLTAKLLGHLRRKQSDRLVRFATFGAVVAGLQSSRSRTTARSILRSAAA